MSLQMELHLLRMSTTKKNNQIIGRALGRKRRERVVAADSYFASVQSTKALEEMGLVFIGVINQASYHYPMEHLQRK